MLTHEQRMPKYLVFSAAQLALVHESIITQIERIVYGWDFPTSVKILCESNV